MASDPFDFSDVITDLENKIDKFMHDETTKEMVSKIFAESTQKLVYDKYDPTVYDSVPETRRYENDGLKDWHNYHVLNIGKMNMTVINETKGAYHWASPGAHGKIFGPYSSEGWDAGYINDIIESGWGYHWHLSRIYQEHIPRPFMEEACDKATDELLVSIHNTFFDD